MRHNLSSLNHDTFLGLKLNYNDSLYIRVIVSLLESLKFRRFLPVICRETCHLAFTTCKNGFLQIVLATYATCRSVNLSVVIRHVVMGRWGVGVPKGEIYTHFIYVCLYI